MAFSARKRGKALEGVLNDLFAAHDILVREAFTLKGEAGDGIIEQIDGLIEYKSHLYLVEMEWLKDAVGRPCNATIAAKDLRQITSKATFTVVGTS